MRTVKGIGSYVKGKIWVHFLCLALPLLNHACFVGYIKYSAMYHKGYRNLSSMRCGLNPEITSPSMTMTGTALLPVVRNISSASFRFVLTSIS